MKKQEPTALLINPWIRDFKCYDEWMEPLGLLWIARFLEEQGVRIHFIDCLDRFPDRDILKPGKSKKFAVGEYSRIELDKPPIYSTIPRKYKQYGISEQLFLERLRRVPEADVILVGSGMTYWCDGIRRTLELTRRLFPKSCIVLGGIYASLCEDHARRLPEVDQVLTGRFCTDHLQAILQILGIGSSSRVPPPSGWPQPDYSLLNAKLGHRAIVTGSGCPFNCSYCASRFLEPLFHRRPPEAIVEQITESYARGIRDFAFYDDALLFKYQDHMAIIVDRLRAGEIEARFHTPNGLHARWITRDVARDLLRGGFQSLRFGFESDTPEAQKSSGEKVTRAEMEECLVNLCEAGFRKEQIGVYLLVGLKGEPWGETVRRARWVQARNAMVLPNFLSPVPHTRDYDALAERYPILTEDPRSHNDLFFALYSGTVDFEEFNALKQRVRDGNFP